MLNFGGCISSLNDDGTGSTSFATRFADQGKCSSIGPLADDNMAVSENGGTPKWMVYNGKPY